MGNDSPLSDGQGKRESKRERKKRADAGQHASPFTHSPAAGEWERKTNKEDGHIKGRKE